MPISGRAARILLVEHEPSVAGPLARALIDAGFTMTTVRTAAEARATVLRGVPDLVLIDMVLPDGDGHDLCDELHRVARAPIVMLTENRMVADRDAWRDGAEDYIVKPVEDSTAIALVRAVLRRTSATSGGSEIVRTGPLEIDTVSRAARIDGREIELTSTELSLLVRLALDAGDVVPRAALMTDVWGARWFGSDKTLDVHVGALRRKLGDDRTHPRFIHTVRGVGFRLGSADELAAVG